MNVLIFFIESYMYLYCFVSFQIMLSLLLPQHIRLKTQICEVLDIELIQQKLENNAFDIYYYSDYVINIMGKLCSPARDDDIAKLKEMKEVIPLFK